MSYLQMERNIIQEVSSNSYRFIENNPRQPSFFFSRYAAKEFLKLYFQKSNELELYDVYILLLNIKKLLLELEILCYSLRELECRNKKKYFETQSQKFSIFVPSTGYELNSFNLKPHADIEAIKLKILQDYNVFVEYLASRFNTSYLSINLQVEKLLSIYLDLIARANLAFTGPLSPNEHRNSEDFNKNVAKHLLEYMGSKEDSYLWKNKFYILSVIFEISALGVFLFPPCEILFGLQMPYVALILAGLGLIIALSNFIYTFFQSDPLAEKYTILSKI